MNNEVLKVLIVEDEVSIRKFINVNLVRNGFEVKEAGSGEEALIILQAFIPDMIVLDIMLPGIDGYETCRKIREQIHDVAIIMLTAKCQDMEKIIGLDLGADDYMIKPFNPLELVARIRAVLRRSAKIPVDDAEVKTFSNITIDFRAKKILKNGVEIELTPREYAIIMQFIENPGKALSRDELLNTVWGKNYFGDLKTLDVHIHRLREKIEDEPSQPRLIETVWGHGYRWSGVS